MAQKTGADAVYLALKKICQIITRYGVKLNIFIDAAVAANVITSGQGTIAKGFLSSAQAACDVFTLLAEYNSL